MEGQVKDRCSWRGKDAGRDRKGGREGVNRMDGGKNEGEYLQEGEEGSVGGEGDNRDYDWTSL